MNYFHVVPGFCQPLPHLFSNQHGAMLSACTPKGDGQVTLALANVVRNQIDQQLRNAGDELPRLWIRQDVTRHLRVPPSKRPKLWNEVWIWQKAYVEHQVGILRHTLAKSETYT